MFKSHFVLQQFCFFLKETLRSNSRFEFPVCFYVDLVISKVEQSIFRKLRENRKFRWRGVDFGAICLLDVTRCSTASSFSLDSGPLLQVFSLDCASTSSLPSPDTLFSLDRDLLLKVFSLACASSSPSPLPDTSLSLYDPYTIRKGIFYLCIAVCFFVGGRGYYCVPKHFLLNETHRFNIGIEFPVFFVSGNRSQTFIKYEGRKC